MKKYITIATLLAAGSAIANAEGMSVSVTSTNTDAVLITSMLTLQQVKDIVDTNGINKKLLGITDSKGNSWSIALGTWSNANKLYVYTGLAGEGITGAQPGDNFKFVGENWNSTDDLWNKFSNLDNAVCGAITLGYQGVFVKDSEGTNVDGSESGTAVVLSVKFSDGSVETIYGLNTKYKNSSNSIATVSYESDYVGNPSVTVTSTAWDSSSLIAHNVAALPEPSTFGLLAGLGALALVGTRRRRR